MHPNDKEQSKITYSNNSYNTHFYTTVRSYS